MNGGSVITNRKAGFKLGKVFGPALYPKFTILNPRFTMTVPENQMKVRSEDVTLLLSKAAYGEFDMILVSKEVYDAYEAQAVAGKPFVEAVKSEGIGE